MSSFHERIAGLRGEKLRLLEALLTEEGGELDSFPLSFAQQRLWFLNQLEPEAPPTTFRRRYTAQGELNIAALERSLNEIVQTSRELRTTFMVVQGASRADHPGSRVELTLPIVDLSGIAGAERSSPTWNDRRVRRRDKSSTWHRWRHCCG